MTSAYPEVNVLAYSEKIKICFEIVVLESKMYSCTVNGGVEAVLYIPATFSCTWVL